MSAPNLSCSRNVDRFTVSESKGNGALDYPVGLLTFDEVMLAGILFDENMSSYLYNGAADNYDGVPYWTGTTVRFNLEATVSGYDRVYNGYSTVILVDVDGSLYPGASLYNDVGVRPSVSLKSGFSLTGNGDGTATNPYVVS